MQVEVPRDLFDGVDRTLLRVRWTGDVGRAYVGDELISDHFWHGRDWDVDLTPWASAVARHGVRFELLPWQRSTGVWVDPTVRDIPDGVHVAAVDVVRVGTVRLTALGCRPGLELLAAEGRGVDGVRHGSSVRELGRPTVPLMTCSGKSSPSTVYLTRESKTAVWDDRM